jgi:hypothetical protein
MRFRHVFMGIGGALTVVLLLLSDPDSNLLRNLPFGGGTLGTLIILVTSVLYISLLHLGRKGLLDYLDIEVFFTKALETSQGAGLAVIAVALMMVSISIVIFAATK